MDGFRTIKIDIVPKPANQESHRPPDYFGVTCYDIVHSIKDAQQFLADIGASPLIQEHIAQITSQDCRNIICANSDEELEEILEWPQYVTGALRDVFELHGILDTNGVGYDIAKKLFVWSEDENVPISHKLDIEIAAHYLSQPNPTDDQQWFYNERLLEYFSTYASQGKVIPIYAPDTLDT